MLYSDTDILRALASPEADDGIVVDGLREGAIQPASIDLHLSDRPFLLFNEDSGPIRVWEDQERTMRQHGPTMMDVRGERRQVFHLYPGEFALASTVEKITLGPQVAAQLEGKSSLGRLGQAIHITAGFFDPGFSGYPTLELLNVTNRSVTLVAGAPIAQIGFLPLLSPSTAPYGRSTSKYQSQGPDPVPSRYWRNFEVRESASEE